MKKTFLTVTIGLITTLSYAQTTKDEARISQQLQEFFAKYKPQHQTLVQQPKLVGYKVDNNRHTLTITANEYFAAQEFTTKSIDFIYKKIKKSLPKPYRSYQLKMITNGMAIEDLIPNRLSKNTKNKTVLWGDINYEGEPWVKNISEPLNITHGLNNRHISLWASHGRYYDANRGWRWQRPKLFSTTEDLFTQTIVVPYLIPMLENAGAIVFTPRERDWQKNEVVVDNDDAKQGTRYLEINTKYQWQTTPQKGFAQHSNTYIDGENPFVAGTARMIKTTSKKKQYSLVSYQPNIPEEGNYAVYVSYQTLPNSIDDAIYTVWHKGEKTEFKVNQQMGGSTWVYLGTFDFDKGSNEFNRVTISNLSSSKGVVTTDAVRFGGGMGNIERGGAVSGLPRCLEGARYYAQWAGMPYSVYSTSSGTNDYKDDINVRSLMTNTLGGGSCYMPSKDGRKVPIELSLAIHSDAGYEPDGVGITGSLAICTTHFNDGRLNAGISRQASRDLADALLSNVTRDIKYKYGQWNKRYLWDKNYSETRLPEVPSAILETMSHQNFPDMRYGQDPNFKFTFARSIYKTLLRYICDQHDCPYIVTPLTPNHFKVEFVGKDEIVLSWQPVSDPQESTSNPTSYIVYTSCDGSGYDNGTYIRSATSYRMKIDPQVLYRFKVVAANRGGKSFPTEELCAYYHPNAHNTIMIIDGFHRLSSPAIRDNTYEQGFDLDEDAGVSFGPTFGWCGQQLNYDRSRMGTEGEDGLGWSNDNLTGVLVAGNDMNYTATHAEAIKSSGTYNIVSASSEAIEMGQVDLSRYRILDLLLGLERNDGHSLKYYKSFSTNMQNQLQSYTDRGGHLLVSGAYIGSDMTKPSERQFLNDVLKCSSSMSYRDSKDSIIGMGTNMTFYHAINEHHYAATSSDCLQPTAKSFATLRYSSGQPVCVAYDGNDYKSIVMGVPFECIKEKQKRNVIMKAFLRFLEKE